MPPKRLDVTEMILTYEEDWGRLLPTMPPLRKLCKTLTGFDVIRFDALLDPDHNACGGGKSLRELVVEIFGNEAADLLRTVIVQRPNPKAEIATSTLKRKNDDDETT